VTATDELRRLLDERGVEHYDGTETTLWGYEPTSESTGAYRIAADEISGGRLQVRMFNVTPTQAIEAALGSCNCSNNCTNSERTGTCRITDNGPWGYPYVCSECGASFDADVNNGEFNFCPNCGRRVEQ